MSDSRDYVEQAKARDTRFAILSRAIAVEGDLRDNETIKAIMASVREDADRAMDDLAEASPADQVGLAALLVRVKTLVYIRRTLNTILGQGLAAEQAIRAEDEAQRDE